MDKQEGLTRDDILDNVTLYWLTNTAVSSCLVDWEASSAKGGFFDPRNVTILVAVSVFRMRFYAAPESWTKKAYPKLIYFNKLNKGGHLRHGSNRNNLQRRCGLPSNHSYCFQQIEQ